MNTRMRGHITKITLCTAALLVTCCFGSPAKAQSNIQARFTLPHETRWGEALLPPGDYQLTFVDNNMGKMLLVRDAKSLGVLAFESLAVSEESAQGSSALLIGMKGKQRVVYSLTIAELGEAFVYERPVQRSGSKEAHQTQAIPLIVAKK